MIDERENFPDRRSHHAMQSFDTIKTMLSRQAPNLLRSLYMLSHRVVGGRGHDEEKCGDYGGWKI